jgi:hypothetical protein
LTKRPAGGLSRTRPLGPAARIYLLDQKVPAIVPRVRDRVKGTEVPLSFYNRLQHAYNRPTLAEAKAALLRVKKELSLQNVSAVRSLEVGFEETLCLHRLDLFREGSRGSGICLRCVTRFRSN